GAVSAIAVGSNSVYLGGTFTNVGGIQRRRLAAVTRTTGAAQPLDPNVRGRASVGVRALQLDGANRLYVGGNFTNIANTSRNGLAALTESGSLSPWDPNAPAATATASASVNCMALSGDTLYVGGDFVNVGGQPRLRIAALD